MNSKNLILPILSLGALFMLPACSDTDDNSLNTLRPTALVTVCPNTDGTFMMQLDNTTQLIPTNLSASPFGKKEEGLLSTTPRQPISIMMNTFAKYM